MDNPLSFALNRRQFLKNSATLAAVSQVSLPFSAKAENQSSIESDEKVVWNTCPGNCHSRCALRLHVKDNEVYQVETDNTGEDIYGNHQVRACLNAKVTPRIMPGVLAMPQGAWHKANMNGDKIDHGGCINTLTTHRLSPLAKGNPQHSNLVQIEVI